MDAAERVCNPSGEIDVFTGIETLLNCSLLRQVKSVTDEPRFDMLQTIRDYALEKAETAGIRAEPAKGPTANTLPSWPRTSWVQGSIAAEFVKCLKRFDEEHDNFRVALSWALQHDESIPLAINHNNARAVLVLVSLRPPARGAGMDRTRAGKHGRAGDLPVRVLALLGGSGLAMWAGDLIMAEKLGRDAVEIAERLGSDQVLAEAKVIYGVPLINQGRDKEAYPHLVDALELFDQQIQPWMKGTALVHLANVSLGLGEPRPGRPMAGYGHVFR